MENGIVKNIKYLINCVMEVIYCGDSRCIACERELYLGGWLCSECLKKIKECNESISLTCHGTEFKCYSAAYYSKVVRELIIKLKYKKDYRSCEILAELMVKVIENNSLKADYITFVPLSRDSKKKRGYNQSQLLARMIGEKTGIKLLDTLKKVSSTKDQIGLGKKERWENIKGSFEIKNGIKLENKNFIVVDDVVTTGATAFWCSDTLIKNGALGVVVLTAAKSGV